MIVGHVNPDNDIVVQVTVLSSTGEPHQIDAILDTGFSGYLTLPPDQIDRLGLPFRQWRMYELANEVEAELAIHSAEVIWAGTQRRIAVVAADGIPLLGVRMLRGQRLIVELVDGGTVQVEALAWPEHSACSHGEVSITIERIGTLTNTVVAEA